MPECRQNSVLVIGKLKLMLSVGMDWVEPVYRYRLYSSANPSVKYCSNALLAITDLCHKQLALCFQNNV